MANYCCVIRTNYFHVKNPKAFRLEMDRVYGYEDNIELWEREDPEGNPIFAFGTYGGISGLRNEDDDDDTENTYDDFIDMLQESVADNDAIIIFESGNEKMRYIVGSATIITSSGYKYIDITDIATVKASEMLNCKSWSTRCEY